MSKKKITLRGLFSNTRFLIAFSIVVAFIFWIAVALEFSPVVENVIEDVPIVIKTENSIPDKLGLEIFGNAEYTVDVKVKGSRYIVGGDLLTADDFEVVAQTAYVDKAGNHDLALKVTAKDSDAEFEITGLSADYINVYFDTYCEKEMEVTPKFSSDIDSYTDDGYIFEEEDVILEQEKVTLAGAKTEIERINNVYANISVDKKLTKNTTIDAPLSFDVSDISHVTLKGEDSLSIPVTLPVYKIQTLNSEITYKNAPKDLLNNLPSYTVSPSTVKVAVLQNGSNNSENLEIGKIYFNQLSAGKQTFTFDASEIDNVKILDKTGKFTVTVDASDYATKSFTIDESNISVSGTTNKNLDIDDSELNNIVVVGKQSELASLNEKSIVAKIDLSKVDLSATPQKVKMNVYLKYSNSCWIYGEYYVSVKLKTAT